MKSFRNHFSLVIALLSILFSLQIFIVAQRAIDAYKSNLTDNYSLVIVSQRVMHSKDLIHKNSLISELIPINPDEVIKKLNSGIDKKNLELLKLSLPKFYRLKLTHYPSPDEINNLTKSLLKDDSVIKVETFSHSHDTIYKLLLLFKTVIGVYALSVAIITTLLISKELKIWQFNHNERMSIMALFGAPTWLRSAVLFRLAFVDALVASFVAFILFSFIASSEWVENQFANIGIKVVVFDYLGDFGIMLALAITLSTLLAALIVLGHKEEV